LAKYGVVGRGYFLHVQIYQMLSGILPAYPSLTFPNLKEGKNDTVARAPGCPPKTFIVQCGSEPLSQEGHTMFGPGEYRPDPSAGITAPADLPQPEIVPYSRNDIRNACPRCGHSAYRDKQSHRTLHDVGNLDVWCPRDLLVTSSQHY
jgi:hypothetical protein